MAKRGNRVCVIGAGPGGLASAMLLAKAGAEVTVIDRLPRPGGRCSALEAEGFRFDHGPTFFLYPRVLDEIFQAVGRDLRAECPMTRLDPQYRLEFGAGGRIDATPDIQRMKQQIAGINVQDAEAFEGFLNENRRKLELFRPILESPFNSLLDLVRPSVLKAVPMVRPWRSVAGDLLAHFSDPRLITAFSFQSKYLGMSPFQCPSLFTILAFLEYEYGVWHPTGGCAAVSERMAQVAAQLGAEVRLNEEVTRLHFEGRRAVGLETAGGQRHNFDALVINADFSAAMQRLVPDSLRRRWSNQRLARSRYSCSTWMMYLGMEGSFPDLPHHTIYISKDYERNLREIDAEGVLPSDPSFYVQNACVTDSTLAPEGRSTLYVLVPVPHESSRVNWQRDSQGFRARVLQQLQRVGLQDLERRIVYEKVLTPDDWQHGFRIYRGATFNLAHNLGQMLHRRPHNRFEDLEHVYLAGGGTHPGSGLPVIYESARISCRMLCAELGLPFPEPDVPISGVDLLPLSSKRVA
ncbi:MAG: phytoene desaturase family protein [Planctomyces sp.]|jgi:phytoene desaturase|nr:phytoene desaturase family protein [Planctomyces sp.]HAV30964.1 phytoene desaturase [Planctomycetaceae bacterium]HBC61866.1 phytoene desaturase [Planctomycetaceae bacterium]